MPERDSPLFAARKRRQCPSCFFPCVPQRLSAGDRRGLAEKSPAVAMLMPAHREVTTPEDAEAFAKPIVDVLRRTPRHLRDSDSLEIIYRSGESANLRFGAVTRGRLGWK